MRTLFIPILQQMASSSTSPDGNKAPSDQSQNDLSNFIASNIKVLRKRVGWSQQELAERVGLNRGNIASYETGTAEPKICKLLTISKLLGVTSRDITRADLSDPTRLEQAMEHFIAEERADKERIASDLQKLAELEEVAKSITNLQHFKLKTLDDQTKQSLQPLGHYFDQLSDLNQQVITDYRNLLDRLKCHC
ncbi:MAG: helix-turn-helix transcriptional regulator [Bacteroidota bacterium]